MHKDRCFKICKVGKSMEKKNIRKRKKTNKWLMVCIILLIVVSVGEVLFIVNMLKNNQTGLNKDKDVLVINAIETPIVDLVYGFEEVDCLKAIYSENRPHALTFVADMGDSKNIEFLKFYFDEDELGTKIANIKGKNGQQVKLSIEKIKIDDTKGLDSSERDELSSLREDLVETMISNFEVYEYFSDNVYLEEYILIDTPYFQIPFSKEWEEYLVVDEVKGNPYKVTFSCKFKNGDTVELFTYSFGENSEDIVGELSDVPVGLTIENEEADETWSQEEIDIFYTMSEEMYYILDGLVATGEFVLK